MTRQSTRPFHPRHLVCPRCGADVGCPCVFAGKEQAEVHRTERFKVIGDPSLRPSSLGERAGRPVMLAWCLHALQESLAQQSNRKYEEEYSDED